MENVMPPPNGSPEEIQAWNNMMDTMVTFIRASTHLMNTITQKVRQPLPGGAGVKNLMSGCEPECIICRPKPPCGVCTSEQVMPLDAPSAARTPPRAFPIAGRTTPAALPGTPAPNVQVVITPPTPEGVGENNPEEGEAAEGGEVAEGENAQEAAVAEDEIAEGPPEEVPAPARVALEPPQDTGIASNAPAEPPQAAGDTDDKCICSAVRAKKLANQKKASCVCAKEESEQTPPEPVAEQMCACGPTAGNQAALVQEMVQKLANAQQEINQLQEEMARLQRMDTSRRTGPHAGPNPAALYREIMRDTEPPIDRYVDRPSQRIPAHLRQRLFQTDTTGNTTVERTECPANPANRLGANVRQRLFQTNTTVDTSQGSGYGVLANSSMQRPDDPANRIPAHLRRRLFQTNTTADSSQATANRSLGATQNNAFSPQATSSLTEIPDDPANRIPAHLRQRLFQTNTTADTSSALFGTSGFMGPSIIPAEGRQLPEGYVGCIPCDNEDQAPSTLGTSLGISPIPGPTQGRIPMQIQMRPVSQIQQESIHMTVPQASRQPMSSRQGPSQYSPGLLAPYRRSPGAAGGSGYRSLASSYRESPSAADGGGWAQNEQYRSLGGANASSLNAGMYPGSVSRNQGGAEGTEQFGSLAGSMCSGNISRTQDSSRRIIMCGPAPTQNDCNPDCQNR